MKKKPNRQNKMSTSENNRQNGFSPLLWGPALWHFLHTISFNYPDHPKKCDKLYYYRFLKNTQKVLPCGKCRSSFETHLKSLAPTDAVFDDNDSFSRFIFKLHKQISKRKGKKNSELKCSYETMKQNYNSLRADVDNVPCKLALYVLPCEDNNNIGSFTIDPKCYVKKKKSRRRRVSSK